MRVSYERFTVDRVISLFLDDAFLSLSLSPSPPFHSSFRLIEMSSLCLSFAGQLSRALSQVPTSETRGVRMPLPLPRRSRGALGSLSATVLSPVRPRSTPNRTHLPRSTRSPCGRRHSAVSIFEYRGIATAMTSLRITGDTRMSPRN